MIHEQAKCIYQASGRNYRVDWNGMQQVNVETNMGRPLRRVSGSASGGGSVAPPSAPAIPASTPILPAMRPGQGQRMEFLLPSGVQPGGTLKVINPFDKT